MSLELNQHSGYIVQAYDEQTVTIMMQVYSNSMMVMPDRAPEPWPVTSFQHIDATHLAILLRWSPELILLGCGVIHAFLPASLMKVCWQAKVACDVMSNASACRTYNVLASEGRQVVLSQVF